jgi:hypothetical protein
MKPIITTLLLIGTPIIMTTAAGATATAPAPEQGEGEEQQQQTTIAPNPLFE